MSDRRSDTRTPLWTAALLVALLAGQTVAAAHVHDAPSDRVCAVCNIGIDAITAPAPASPPVPATSDVCVRPGSSRQAQGKAAHAPQRPRAPPYPTC